MAEYIERSEIFSVWRSMPAPASVTSLSAAIHQTTTIDIVRCKECKKFVTVQGRKACTSFFGLSFPNDDGSDFCSYGERKEEG